MCVFPRHVCEFSNFRPPRPKQEDPAPKVYPKKKTILPSHFSLRQKDKAPSPRPEELVALSLSTAVDMLPKNRGQHFTLRCRNNFIPGSDAVSECRSFIYEEKTRPDECEREETERKIRKQCQTQNKMNTKHHFRDVYKTIKQTSSEKLGNDVFVSKA